MNRKTYTALLFAAIAVCTLALASKQWGATTYPVTVAYAYPSSSVSSVVEERMPASSAASEATVQGESELVEGEETELPVLPEITFPLELNTCTEAELLLIPKVGAVTARRIVQYRDALGGYTDISQLLDIKGIGPSGYETISAYVYIRGDEWDTARRETESNGLIK